MKVIVYGGTGMVGHGVLLECLDDPDVSHVLAIGRRASGLQHDKLRDFVLDNLFDYSAVEDQLGGYDACFFCLGVSAAGLSEEEYHRITYELTVAAAETLATLNPEMTFCYVSGAGTDSSERGRIMWARVKGKTENALLRLPFKAAFMFRPGFIQPMRGVKSQTRLYRIGYAVASPVFPILSRVAPRHVTTTQRVGLAMIQIARTGHQGQYLENADINEIAEST